MSGAQVSVSVVIPTFNRIGTIAATIESALAQTLSPVEVIVVDDCSGDGTQDVVGGYPDDRVRLIAQPSNKGGGAARNVGIEAAQGEWVALLDSDDLWRPDKLLRQYGQIGHADDAISFTNLEFFDGAIRRKYWNRRAPRAAESMTSYMVVDGQAVQTSTLFMRRSVAMAVRFDARLRRHQDWDFVLRAERAGFPFRYLDEPLTLYRLADTASVSRNTDIVPSRQWIDWAGDLLDDRARASIELNVILPRLVQVSRIRAARHLIAVAISGAAVPWHLLRAARAILRGY